MTTEIVKMSSKGQLVVPMDIRDQEGFSPSDRFIPFPVKDGVIFKKIKIPDVEKEFEKTAKEIQKQFNKAGVTRKDVDEAIRWARK